VDGGLRCRPSASGQSGDEATPSSTAIGGWGDPPIHRRCGWAHLCPPMGGMDHYLFTIDGKVVNFYKTREFDTNST
jgi:hypothetical protein